MYASNQTRALQQLTTSLLKRDSKNPVTAAEIEQLRDALKFHEYRYYILNEPLISDGEYDQLFKAL